MTRNIRSVSGLVEFNKSSTVVRCRLSATASVWSSDSNSKGWLEETRDLGYRNETVVRLYVSGYS